MASVPQRHTYYGGETAGVYERKADFTIHGGQSRQKRKNVTFGPYILGSTLGEGEFGRVKLGWSKNTSPNEVSKQVAIKLIRRDTIPKNSEKEIKIYREINALKHLSHPNIVRLEEVLQNSKYIGIVLEYASGGEFYKYIQKKRRLKEGVACRLFSQLISGVHYMHSKGLVHRDLKLENLLLDKHENLIITDFGFVNEFFAHSELMKTSCGSPCYAAPELVVSSKPYEARKADIWSCGVILYAMLAGYLPWDDDSKNPDGNDIAKLYHYITRTPLKFPEYITPLPRDLLRRILYPDPKRRISMRTIQKHEWVRPHQLFLSITPEEWDKTMLSNEIFRPPRMKPQGSSRPRSNCSTSSTGSKSDKRDSLIIDSTLVNLPAPPQESQSHVIAKPSPPSPELRRSPIRGMSRHSRSNSAASIALQAVVDAEREHNSPQEPHTATPKKNYPYNNRSSPAFVVHRSNTHTGTSNVNSSLMNKDSVIIETSPAKGSMMLPVPNESLVPPLSQAGKVSSGSKLRVGYSSSNGAGQYHHSAAQHRKPRPTSYHPASSSSVVEQNTIYTPLMSAGETTSHGTAAAPSDSTPTLAAETPVQMSPTEHSPSMLQRRSFSMSKPSIELQSVSGDLIRSPDDAEPITRRINEQVEDADNKQRRQSFRLSGVAVEKMCSPVTEETEEALTPGSANDQISRKPAVERRPENRKRFSFLSFYSAYNTSKSSLDTVESRTVSSVASSRQPLPNSQPRSGLATITAEREDYRITSTKRSENRAHRQSMMNPDTSTPQLRPQGDQSTAKKVIDFFKRRSMRI